MQLNQNCRLRSFSLISYVVLGVLLPTLAGCSKEHGRSPLVRIVPHIETRATALDFETGDCIGLDIVRTSGSYKTNEPLTYDGSSFVSGSLLWYADASDAATLTAYYPYAAGGRPDRFSVEADQSQGVEKSDLLGARALQVTPSAAAVSMTFKHLLARLVINLDNVADAAIASVELAGLTGTATIDWSELVATATGEAMTITPYNIETNNYMAILVPQEGTLTIRVRTQSGRQEETQAPVALEKGKSYTLSMTLTEEGLKVKVSGDITDWENGGDPTTGGDASGKGDDDPTDDDQKKEEQQPSETEQLTIDEIVYPVRKIGDNYWMAENLRNLPSGKVAGENGLWNPSQNAQAAPELVVTCGYLYDYATAQSLCPTGWHLPTKAELAALIGADTGAEFFTAAGFWRGTAGAGSYSSTNYLLGTKSSDSSDECDVLRFEATGALNLNTLSAEYGYSVRFVKD